MNNSALRRVSPGKARADGACRLGCSPSLACSPCGAVRLGLPATLLVEGRAAYGTPRLRLPCGAWENSALCSPGPFAHVPQQVGSCCAPLCLGLGRLAKTAARLFFPFLSFAYFYNFGTEKQFNSVLPLPSTVVTVLEFTDAVYSIHSPSCVLGSCPAVPKTMSSLTTQ